MCKAGDMSHAVDPTELAAVAEPYGSTPFLLYTSSDGSARVNHVLAEADPGQPIVRIRGFGRGVVQRVSEGAQLSLLWPAPATETFSLIADGSGEVEDETLILRVTAAVLHRPAPVDGDASC